MWFVFSVATVVICILWASFVNVEFLLYGDLVYAEVTLDDDSCIIKLTPKPPFCGFRKRVLLSVNYLPWRRYEALSVEVGRTIATGMTVRLAQRNASRQNISDA